jgi:phosphogluconate dehydratase
VTRRVEARSEATRAANLDQMKRAAVEGPRRRQLGAANQAHAYAGTNKLDRHQLRVLPNPAVGIVTSYNDMLSAHAPYASYPDELKVALREVGATGQVAGGVPAMCDGITQGYPGMELSLFSRDTIAMSTAVALSHASFDAVLCLGVCDKIVPGLLMGALRFAHLPVAFVPAGPMPTGISNAEKAKVRDEYAKGQVDGNALLANESKAYHSPGTCTFYGTANTNQLLMEIMGLHLPGASFVQPNTALRRALTAESARRLIAVAGRPGGALFERFDARNLINGCVALLATGGSTNHTLHLPAIAAAAGYRLGWEDLEELSQVVPLLLRLYPNGSADVNRFHELGGVPRLCADLLDAGLLHAEASTVFSDGGLADYRESPRLEGDELHWAPTPVGADEEVFRSCAEPFAANGGLKLLRGNLGRAVIKVSAVAEEHHRVRAPALVFESQEALQKAYRDGQLDGDFVAVVRGQGPRARGMPELHKLTPPLRVLQSRGQSVALVTDGRMSGASGKIPSAIHLTPESSSGGPISRVRDGDIITLDATAGTLDVGCERSTLEARKSVPPLPEDVGFGRELFANFRRVAGPADEGASVFTFDESSGSQGSR